MSDRKEFQANRDAGLAIRQQRRIETREELRRRTRREVAEEIAQAIEEAAASIYYGDRHALHEAVEVAREIGAR